VTDSRATTPLAPLDEPVRRPRGIYDLVIMAFCVFLLLSNIGATKLIEVGPVLGLGPYLLDGGAILFPLTYVLGDVLTEVYGLRGARRAILAGFAVSVFSSLALLLVTLVPPAAGFEASSEAFSTIFGVVPRFVLASICGYLVGQFINAWVLVKIKQRTGEKALWARLLGSTVIGEIADTLVFASVAWIGVLTVGEFTEFVVVGFVFKTLVEVVMLPVTYRVIAVIKRQEGIRVR
jgi:uncharacterized integral membrane protein (TIGR00697 family)